MNKTTPETYRDPAAGDLNDEADRLHLGDEADDAAAFDGDDEDDEDDEDDDDDEDEDEEDEPEPAE
jgi:ribonuclease E